MLDRQNQRLHLSLRQGLLQLRRTLHPHQTKTLRQGNSPITQPPGQIIKPKPENKRGRPRKNPSSEPCLPSPNLPLPHSLSSGVTPLTASSNFISGLDCSRDSFQLRPSPGSQFKSYRSCESLLPGPPAAPAELDYEG